MAIYHLTAKTGSRGGGQSAGAKDEYIEREGKYAGHDGQKKSDVQISLSGNMPKWAKSPGDYWKAADQYERANGRLYKEVEFAFPKELNATEREHAAREFARYLTGKENLPYTLAIHINDKDNPHCHLMISERVNDGIYRPPDRWFSRANTADPEKGGAKKTTALKPEEWLMDTREAWAKIANEELRRATAVERIDHRSLEAQGIKREPTKHRGVNRKAKELHALRRGLEQAEAAERAAAAPTGPVIATPPDTHRGPSEQIHPPGAVRNTPAGNGTQTGPSTEGIREKPGRDMTEAEALEIIEREAAAIAKPRLELSGKEAAERKAALEKQIIAAEELCRHITEDCHPTPTVIERMTGRHKFDDKREPLNVMGKEIGYSKRLNRWIDERNEAITRKWALEHENDSFWADQKKELEKIAAEARAEALKLNPEAAVAIRRAEQARERERAATMERRREARKLELARNEERQRGKGHSR